MESQRTLARPIECAGTGLHGAAPARVELLPAPEDAGIAFVCESRGRRVEVPARAASIAASERATSLAREGAGVATVEHLLGALYGLGVDNLRVRVEGPELPALDGSAAPWVALLRRAGLREQSAPKRPLVLADAVECREGAAWIRAEPSARFSVHYAIDFEHPAVGRQALELDAEDPERFAREIAPARTFGFASELEALLGAGLARGGSLACAILLDERGVANPEGLRFPDEPVRHKVLDLLGDLALLGSPLRARVRVERGGHRLHRALVAALEARAPSARSAS